MDRSRGPQAACLQGGKQLSPDEERIERLSAVVRKLASWNGTDISELIEIGMLEEGDLA